MLASLRYHEALMYFKIYLEMKQLSIIFSTPEQINLV